MAKGISGLALVNSKILKLALVLVATLFVGAMDFLLFRPIFGQAATSGWPSTPGQLTAVDYVRKESTGTRASSTYRLKLAYTYRVGSQDFTGDRHSLSSFGTSGQEWYRDFVETHPVGTKVSVYYNPDAPKEAVLEKGLQGADLSILLVAGLFNGALFFGWVTTLGDALPRKLQAALLGGSAGLGCLTFPAIFLVGALYRFRPPLNVIQGLWLVIFVASAWIAWSSYKSPENLR